MIDPELFASVKANRAKLEHDVNTLISFLKETFLEDEAHSIKLYELLINGRIVQPDNATEEEQEEDNKVSARYIELACKYAGAKALLDIMDAQDI